jgi:dTDP-glucose 4,6-dehydratase
MKNKILILGATSFGGSSFLKFLKKKTNNKLWGTYRSKSNLKKLFKKNIKNYDFIKLDLSSSNNNLVNLVEKIRPNYIFDFASVCLVNESWQNPNYYFNVNYFSKIDIIKKLHKYDFLKSYVYISTPEVFGSTLNPVKEDKKNFNPSTPYALSKLNLEQMLTMYNSIKKKSIIVRASNFYGLDQLDHRLIPKLIKYIKNKKKFPLHGNGDSKRDFIFEEDFNDGLLRLIMKGKNGNFYHFSSNKHYTIKNVVKIVCDLLGENFKKYIYKTKDRIGKDKYYFLDCKNTKKQLNWKPKINIYDGIKKIIKHKNK